MPEPVKGGAWVPPKREPAGTVGELATDMLNSDDSDWRESAHAKRLLDGILWHVRCELERNYCSLQDALDGSHHERLEADIYRAAEGALALALKNDSYLLDAVAKAYEFTEGDQRRLRELRWSQPERTRERLTLLASMVGRARLDIDKFRRQNGFQWHSDCTFRLWTELLDDIQKDVKLRISQFWKQFRAALAAGQARGFLRAEVAEVEAQGLDDPMYEDNFRHEAQGRWGPLHSFELDDGIFEVRFAPAIRILYAELGGRPVALDLVLLRRSEEESWCPWEYVEQARCRRDRWQPTSLPGPRALNA